METYVCSSQILSVIEYCNDTKEMTVEFKNGNKYKYFDVPREEFEALQESNSIGKYFNKIKNNFRVEKL